MKKSVFEDAYRTRGVKIYHGDTFPHDRKKDAKDERLAVHYCMQLKRFVQGSKFIWEGNISKWNCL